MRTHFRQQHNYTQSNTSLYYNIYSEGQIGVSFTQFKSMVLLLSNSLYNCCPTSDTKKEEHSRDIQKRQKTMKRSKAMLPVQDGTRWRGLICTAARRSGFRSSRWNSTKQHVPTKSRAREKNQTNRGTREKHDRPNKETHYLNEKLSFITDVPRKR